MGLACACQRRCTEPDNGTTGDHYWPVSGLGPGKGRFHCVHIMAAHTLDLPARRFKAFHLIGGVRQIGAAIDGDLVVVKQDNQI